MASFIKKTSLLVFFLISFVHLVIGYTLVPGIPFSSNSGVPQRREIRTCMKDATFMNIYLLGLSSLQNISSNQLLSHYRMSTIHGTNYPWDGDNGGNYPNDNGYCRHADPLFPTWHRPYLSMYEKAILDEATKIVQAFPAGTVKDQHLAALQTWRMPYWDWAMDASMPDIMYASKKVPVTMVQNKVLQRVSINNPMYSYSVDRYDPYTTVAGDPQKGTRTMETVRNPIAQSKIWVSQPSVTNNNMIRAQSAIRKDAYDAVMLSKDYKSFSNMQDSFDSIESVHGAVHVTVGGSNGHMAYIGYAAFDPIFYLHHCNIDRLFAMWQVLYPNSYVSNKANDFPNENTELHPFRNTQTRYWTSKLARNTSAFGYTYPETANANPESVKAAINALYGSNSSKKRRKRGLDTDSDTYDEYLVRIKISNAACYGSFSVNIFLGTPSLKESEFRTDPNYVGSFHVFTRRNITKSRRKIVRGKVCLTTALEKLVDAGKLKDMTLEAVKPYVKRNFEWTITGDKMGDYDFDGLDITIVTAEVKPPEDLYSFPERGPCYRVYKVI